MGFGGGGTHDPRLLGVSLNADATPVNNSTVLVNSNLVLPLSAGVNYYIRVMAMFDSDGSADSKIGFVTPTLRTGNEFYTNNFTTNVSGKLWTASQNGAYSADFRSINVAGYMQVAVAGNLVLQYAQQNAFVVDTFLKQGSFVTAIEMRRL